MRFAAVLAFVIFAAACARGDPATLVGLPDVTVSQDGGDDGPPSKADAATTDVFVPDDSMQKRCATNDDCRASPTGPVCDTLTGQCAQCTPRQDMCPPGQFCDPMNNTCRSGCTSDADCGVGGVTRCDAATRRCVGCTADADCALGTLCRMGACVPGCNEGHGCGVGQSCCSGQCIDLAASTMHCGACGRVCEAGTQCCGGACQSVATDVRNCGRCGNTCVTRNGTASCVGGACGVGVCEMGYGDCDRDASNGCEVNFAADMMHCGACGRPCAAAPNATSRCVMGRCTIECAAGFGDCDGDASNGCETSLQSDERHCGMCGRACATGPSASATCTMGVCALRCTAGSGDCDGDATNGCETLLMSNASHCGACGVLCTFANGNAACTGGNCSLASCRAGFDNCDGNVANGCETSTVANNSHCGRCGNACSPGTACSMGTCSTVCAAGSTFCGGRCVVLQDDAMNCGTCGRVCAGGANATGVCRGGACGVQCASGFGDCDNNAATGCETPLRSTVEHCGACGNVCRASNAAVSCSDGTCRITTCNAGFGNCNGADADGCEVRISADVLNCGACGRACALPNAGAACTDGACRVSVCSPGFENCNGVDADGCEVNTANNNFNCGRCGVMCAPGTACSGGACSSVCAPGTTFCSGSCVSLATDARNCGACGNVCAAGQMCIGGVCRLTAPANDTCANAQTIVLATTQQSIAATTVGANNTLRAPCGVGGADVWFRFTLAQREIVYADTVGATYDTILYFASSCSTPLSAPALPGTVFCNDDMVSAGCSGGGLQSQVIAILDPGTYFLVLAGYGTATGPANIRFQHLPVGNGALALANPGTATYSGVTSGTGRVSGSCGGGGAPENTLWWKSCPDSAGGAFSATTCSRASWDTLLYIRNGDGIGDACVDDTCGLQTTVSSTLGRGAGLHVLYIDGFGSSAGSYSIVVSRP